MTKHKRCSFCRGNRKIIQDTVDQYGRPRAVEVVCPVCKGTGFEEKESNNSDDIRLH